MAKQPIEYYASLAAASDAAARLNHGAAANEVYEAGCFVPADGPMKWYVRRVSPKCPIRGIEISSIRVESWRSEIEKMLRNEREYKRRFFLLAGLTCTIVVITFMILLVYGSPAVALVCGLVDVAFGAPTIYTGVKAVGILKDINSVYFYDCDCGKRIRTDIAWTCGRCNEKNEILSGVINSFLHKCRHCLGEPDSFVCYHCGRVIPLILSADFRHPAFATSKTPPGGGVPLVAKVEPTERWKADVEAQIKKMMAEKIAFSTITQKVCELRDTEIRRIQDDPSITDPLTKKQLVAYENQWANTKLQDLKMRAVKSTL